MPIQHQFTVICEHYSIDSIGRPTFVGVFNVVRLDKLPDVLHTLGIGVGFVGEPEKSLSITVRKPDGSVMLTLPVKKTGVPLSSLLSFVMIGTMVLNIEFSDTGMYHVVLQDGETDIHEMPFLTVLNEDSTEVGDTTNGISE